ncbi:DUF488 domain-containing protein [Acidisoma cellulosilytica]|uniref:DUF488 domain-containing protein n=1 Tax=Acidisoma cellulosilyticum TaxID=2802395 RepID=A0A964E3V8_9PROT|nr:DUF488 domain-containing protein [Acidisoma cellulosilyticum]MCB8880637.1 DUF488 domain-containing protein [Acidisoma cellulosilyticum]
MAISTAVRNSPAPVSRLLTIGYEKAGFGAFIATLRAAGVKTLIDVRDLPLSRRAGFSKRQLAAGLDEAGIAYVHLRALGTPAPGREANRRRQWPLFWDIVEQSLARPEAQVALAEAGEIARASLSCLLCYEADACTCHRRRVGDMLQLRHGFAIDHLHVAMPFER